MGGVDAGEYGVVIEQGEVWWADLPIPFGSEPGYWRPVLVVQGDSLNRSALRTVVCVSLTSKVGRATAPGNVLLAADKTGLPRDSVAIATQIATVDRSKFIERTGKLSVAQLDAVFRGIDVVLGRS
jgi:mRNA interferase MazF